MEENKIAMFEGKKVRRVIYNKEWWFSIVDTVEVLTDAANPRVYWGVMKNRLKDDEKVQLFTICNRLTSLLF